MIKILYIEDDSAHIELTHRSLENSGIEFDLQTASTITNAFSLLKDNEYDVILTDYRLPDGTGLDVIRIAHEQNLSTGIVLITNQEDITTAITALKAGAVDYVVKQSDYLLKLPIVLNNAHKHTQIEKQKKALYEAENKYRNIFENSAGGIFQSSPDGHFLSINPTMAKIFGYQSPEEMIEKVDDINTQIHLSPDSREQFTKQLSKNGTVENFEAKNKKKDGGIIWTSTNARVVKDNDGKTLYFEGFVTDITKQKNAESALIEAEERYRSMVEKLPAVVFMDKFNQPQITQYMSPRLKDLLGYTPEEWALGDNLWENSLHPDDKERVIAEDARTDATGDPFRIEYRIRHRDGHYVWVKEDASIILEENGQPLFWQGILLDITDQKYAEETLQRRDAIIKAVGFSADQFLKSSNWEESINLVLAKLGETTQVSRVYVFKKQIPHENNILLSQAFEWCNNEITPQINNENLRSIDLAKVGFSRWIEFFNKGLPVYGHIKDFPATEQRLLEEQDILALICIPLQIGKDWWGFIGFDECAFERTWTEAEIEALKAAANTLGAAIEKKMSEEALLHSETSYRGLFNSINDAIYVQNVNGVFLDLNNGAINMYGYPKEYLIGKTPEILSAPGKNDMDQIGRALQKAFDGETQQFEFWGKRSNGEIFPKDVRVFKGNYFGQEVLIAVSQDITARKRAENDLQKQLKELSVLHSVALVESIAKSTDELIQRVTDIIGDSMYPDNCGVLLLNETRDELKPHPSYRGTNMANLALSTPLKKGIAGKVASTGIAIRSGNVSLDPAYYETTDGIRSELCVLIKSETRIIGVLNVESKQLDAFSKTDERLLNTIAGGLANAIERIQLFELEQTRRKQAEILREVTGTLTSFVEQNKLFENIFISLSKLVSYNSASIEIIKGEYIEIVAGQDIPTELIGKKYLFNPKKWEGLYTLRQPVIIPDVQNDERFEKFEETKYIRGWMGIPLFAKDKVIGFLNFDSRTPNFFNEEHAAIAQTFANQAAIALENSRLFELEQHRRHEAEILSLATSALANTLDINSLYENILDWLFKITPYDSASILLIEGDSIRITASRGLPSPEKILDQTFPLDNILCQIMNETNEPLIIEDCNNDPRFERWGETNSVRGWMGVPMLSRGQVIGYLNLDSHTPNTFTQNDAITTKTFAHQAGTSLENSRLYTETRQRLDELEIVSRVSFALRAAKDADEMLPILLNEIKASVDTDSAAIWLYDFENNELISKATAGKFNNLPKPNFKPNEGIVGMVYSSGAAHTTTASRDPLVNLENAKLFGENGNGIAVPIRTSTETIGALAVSMFAPHKVKAHQTRLITTLAEIAGNAIYRSTLYERSEEQIQRLTTLRELDTAIASSLDLHITLGIVTENLISKMGVDAAAILVFNPDSQMLEYYAATGFKNRNILRTSVSIGISLASQILLSRKAMYIKDIKKETNLLPADTLAVEKFTSYYAMPLFSKGATRGILEIYFRSPFSPTADWVDFLHTLAGQTTIAIDNAQLFINLQQSNQELSLAYDTTLEGWGKALELRDKETQGHTRRVTNLTLALARQMNIPEAELLQIRRGALLHDIGKMGVPDNILRKEGPLSKDEIVEMRKHPQYAYDLLAPITYLRPAIDIAYAHHEWWDGSGYPRGLKGEEIPLSARIFAVVDVWDALSSDRPYRKAWSRKKILDYIKNLSGKQFDARVLSIFLKMIRGKTKSSNSPRKVRPKSLKVKKRGKE